MRNWFCFIFAVFGFTSRAQLLFTDKQTDLGIIPEAYELKGDVIITNQSDKKVFLLRADADKGVKVFASKKTLLPGDTGLLVISFIPEEKGKFKKSIKLIASDKENPYELSFTGNLMALKHDDKTACFYFGSRKHSNVNIKEEPIVVNESNEHRDISNRIPDNSSEPIITKTADPVIKEPEKEKISGDENELSVLEYKPNNIVFLVDVSNSMKDSLKLPLMKTALYTLIDAVRDIDRITFLTYADSVRIIKEGISGANKTELKEIVSSLKAKGLTKGNKAILRSQLVAQKHYIQNGNNQVIMATDGEFRFYDADYKKWTEAQGDKKIILTTVAFGDDKTAVKNLKDIAFKGEGSFIHVKKKNGNEQKLLEEIKLRSKR